MDDGFIRVARSSEIQERKSKRVVVGGAEIALWRVEGRIYAISNVCAHQHFSSLHQGTLEGTTVTCPMHGWSYSLESGVSVHGNGRIRTYRVKVAGDEVFVEDPSSDW